MADPIDPNAAAQAARGLRMPGVGGMLSSAGDAISSAAGSLRDGAMSMFSRAAASPVTGQVVKAATNAPATMSNAASSVADAATSGVMRAAASPIVGNAVSGVTNAAQSLRNMSLPTIDPSLIENAKATAGDWAGNVRAAAGQAGQTVGNMARGAADTASTAFNGLRAGMASPQSFLEGDASIPTLNNVIEPGMGPHAPVPEIPTLTDVIPPNHPMLENARAPTNAAFANGGMSAERAAYNAEQAAQMGQGFSRPATTLAGGASRGAAINDAATLAEGFKPMMDAARAGLRAAAPVLEPLGAVASKVAPIALPATVAASLYGSTKQNYDQRLGTDSKTLAENIGTQALGTLGDLGNTMTFGLADRVGNALAGNGFGHSSFYNSGEAPAAPAAPATPSGPAGQAPGTPAKDIVGEHYGTPDDITEFNNRMKDVGAGSISMRAGADGSRVIGNDSPASKEMQDATTQQGNARTAQLAAFDNANREAGMRQMQQGQIMQNPDVVRLTDELHEAQRSGSPVAVQSAFNARDNLIRTLSQDRQTQAQAGVTMRGQDLTAQEHRATNQLGMYNAMREQANFNTREGREQAAQSFTQGESAEKHLDDALTSRFTTGTDKDGKPQVDVQAKNAALAGIQRSAAALGANSVADLSKPDRERLIAGADLAAKVNKDASNILPWKPDVIGEVMPHDLIGLQKNGSGDYVIPRGAAKGRVIPARYMNKVGADRIGGQPTDIYDNLKAQ